MPRRYSFAVEKTDRKILSLLAADGRMSFTDLGKATGLSTSAVHQRVKRLEQRGMIRGYVATVDHEQMGLPLTAFVSITPIDPSEPDDYPDRLRGVSEIESCWSVAGDESYILKVRVATPGALEDLLARIRSAANVSSRDDHRPLHAVREPAGVVGVGSDPRRAGDRFTSKAVFRPKGCVIALDVTRRVEAWRRCEPPVGRGWPGRPK